MLFAFIDTFFFLFLYYLFYKCCVFVFQEHPHFFKVVGDIDFRFNNFSLEMNQAQKHAVVHSLISIPLFILLLINPVAHTLMYIFLGFLDVMLLNRILLYLTLLKILSVGELFQDVLLYFVQVVLIFFNYANTDALGPVIFQLTDEAFHIEQTLLQISSIYEKSVGNDSSANAFLLNAILWYRTNKRIMTRIRLVALFLISLISFCYSTEFQFEKAIFFYYASIRLVVIRSELQSVN